VRRGTAQPEGLDSAGATSGRRGRGSGGLSVEAREHAMASSKTIKVRQVASPARRKVDQPQTLIGLGLNRIARVSELPDPASTRGMIAKVRHLVRVEGEDR